MKKIEPITQKVLLVDDDESLLDALKRILRKESYEVLTAYSANEALKVVQATAVSVVIVDQEMPEMRGTEFLRVLKKKSPETVRIMLTGNPQLDTALMAINEGEIYRFFTKPCNDIDLIFAIREAIKQQELIAQSRRLIEMMRAQKHYIEKLEQEAPGITNVKRSATGAVMVEAGSDLDEVIKEVTQELEKAEMRLGTSKIGKPLGHG